jgi:hypothetical protein
MERRSHVLIGSTLVAVGLVAGAAQLVLGIIPSLGLADRWPLPIIAVGAWMIWKGRQETDAAKG